MSTAEASPRTWQEALREPVGIVARPVEWWEWLLAARDGWREAHPGVLRALAIGMVVLVWLAIPALVLAILLVPRAADAFGQAWPCWWLLLCWFVLARTKTISWALYARTFAICVLWSMVIGLISAELWPLAVASAKDAGAYVGIAPATEESLKLVPLLVFAVVAPGRVRRFAVVDWLLLGFASGLGFLLVEEMTRQVAVSPRSLFGPAHVDFTISPVSGGHLETFDGVMVAEAGHHIHTAVIAVVIGLAAAVWRRGGSRPVLVAVAWRAAAVLMPVLAWWLAVTDHAGWNAVAVSLGDETVDSRLDWADGSRVAPVIAATWTALGLGRGRGALLLVLLAVALLADARRMYRADRGVPLVPELGWTDPDIAVAPTRKVTKPMLADGVPSIIRVPLRALIALLETGLAMVTYLLRDVVIVVLAHARAPVEEEPWTARQAPTGGVVRRTGRTVLTGLARGRLAVSMIRDARLDAQELAAGPVRRLVQVRLLGLLGILLMLAAAGPLAVWWAGNIGDHLGLGGSWLAGLFENLGRWWDGIGPLGQMLVVFGIAALLAFTGLGFGAALFLTGIGAYLLTHRRGVAAFARDPAGATRYYLATRTPQGMLLDALEFGFTFIPAGAGGATAGRALRLGLARYLDDPVAYRAALRATMRDETGAVDPNAWLKFRKRAEPPDAPLSQAEIDRRRALGEDPAIGGKFRRDEAHAAVMIEDERNILLKRSPRSEGPDWLDTRTGETYDAVGSGLPEEHFIDQWRHGSIKRQIGGHLSKANFVPVDVSSLSPEQKGIVIDYVESLNNPRVFVIGH